MRCRRLLTPSLTLALLLIGFPDAAMAGGASVSKAKPSVAEATEAGRWGIAISLGFLIIGIPVLAWAIRWVWWTTFGRRSGTQPALWWGRSLVVGDDNRVSTSKTMALIWTYTVAAALLSFLVARWLGHSEAFNTLTSEGLNAQYAVLIGGPIGAAILAKGIVSSQVSSGSAAKTTANNATPAQLVQNDAGQTDLGDVQYLLFNVVALIFFYGELFRAPQLAMPTIPDVLVGLTSVSAVGFVGKKALSGPAGVSGVEPGSAPVGDPVTVATAGIIQAANDLPGVTVNFGQAKANPPLTATETTTQGILIGTRVPPEAAGKLDVTVSSVNGKAFNWPGFAVIPRIAPGQNLAGRRGTVVPVQTTGVTGLAGHDLTVTIGEQSADCSVDPNGNLEITVPPAATAGPTTLTVSTPGGQDHVAFIVD